MPFGGRHGHETNGGDRVGDDVERVYRAAGGEGGDDEVGEGGDGDVEGEEEPRQRWTRKCVCGWDEEAQIIFYISINVKL